MNFLADPAYGADVRPALWRSDVNPAVVVLAAPVVEGIELGSAVRARTVLSTAEGQSTRHLVLGDGRRRYRLVVTPSTGPVDYIVSADNAIPLRLAALGAFCADRRSQTRSAIGNPLCPSDYVRHRLSLLLAILDMTQDPAAPATTVRQIAHELIFPGLACDRAAEWKSSSRRRQTQRLIAEAKRLSTGGYLNLLHGTLRNRTRISGV